MPRTLFTRKAISVRPELMNIQLSVQGISLVWYSDSSIIVSAVVLLVKSEVESSNNLEIIIV